VNVVRSTASTSAAAVLAFAVACSKASPTTPSGSSTGINSDAALFQLVTQAEPFGGYALFPNAEAVTRGTLNGSDAHQPMVRVSLNAKAMSALQNGKLPSGTRFPNGSVVFKEIRSSGGSTMVYTVLYKDSTNTAAGQGWLWAEFNPNGSVAYSITNRGSACTSCHSREQGPQNDFVRTFERQRP